MIFRLSRELIFPDPSLSEPDGLLAVGGDLEPERVLLAYRSGIFPWPVKGQPLLWFSPPERFVLFPEKLKVSTSMRKVFRDHDFELSTDKAFEEVITACASVKRPNQRGTWITSGIKSAYIRLHRLGYAHSSEAWKEDKLVGGLYGIVQGSVFCGESMFSKESNASKAAFIHYVQNSSFRMIDCQVHTAHLESLGAELISRERYLDLLKDLSSASAE
ncbi:MAG TPA: leucyl/phenylalanyl-tRNA--protein transferase [Bacteroidia bacterium]|jgi:leucyl/phenylalanyl-tRNA--protein transferase|nr:leucyl/phenylalanyl-tRNA--protein transferase [Bacteroidia bacterium]